MPVSRIKLNGTFIDATVVDCTRQRRGVVLTPQNGSDRYALRAIKRTWEISSENVDAATKNVYETAYSLAGTFVLIDETNTSYTILCKDEPLQITTSVQERDLSAMYYTISMTVHEA